MKPRLDRVSLTVFLFAITALSSNSAMALEWKNLWTTPDQRAKKQLDGQQYNELVEQAPNANWKAIGEYRNGDYASAIESFSQQRATAELAGSALEAEQAIYNQANAQTLNENYPEAISLFDELLESNPEHADAIHNRAIAEQLLEQQQQEQQQEQQEQQEQQQQEQEQEQEQQENSDDQQSDEQNDDQPDNQKQDQQEDDQQDSDKQEQQDSDQQQQRSEEEQNSENAENTSEDSEQGENDDNQKEQDEQAARAMQAEQEKAQNDEHPEDEAGEQGDAADELADAPPLTEKEQANEQWLRQIPDDPAGLLQRKLQNRHITDFPKVKDSVEPW